MSKHRRSQKQKFNFGDIVRVRGYENELFRISSFTSIYYHYPDAVYKEYSYELTRIPDEEWLEAVEDEMTLVCTAEEAEELLARYQAKKQQIQENNLLKEKMAEQNKQQQIDHLLDDYIAYMELYSIFHDDCYKILADDVIMRLNGLVNPPAA